MGGERLINTMFKIIQNNLQIIAKNKEGFVRQRREGRGLTGGLVAAFKDSISAWVIQTLLVDCSKQKENIHEKKMAATGQVTSRSYWSELAYCYRWNGP